MSFLDNLEKNINEINNLQTTENGAIGFRSTNHPLLDMNFKIPSYRTESVENIIKEYESAYKDNQLLPLLWMFFVRDPRGGLGERRLFRILFRWWSENNPEVARKVLEFVPEYGRWDDIIKATEGTPIWDDTCGLIKEQLHQDIVNYSNDKPVSLLAKWLPSERTSSQKSRKLARKIAKGIGVPIKNYNRILVSLRKHIDIVESKMSARDWKNIDYSTVPSKANLIYKDAFLRNDKERRERYLMSLENGETKINSSVLYPHEIVHKYTQNTGFWYRQIKPYDTALEELWKALPKEDGLENTIVVADGSGSMRSNVGGTSTTALEISHALAIYCSEHCNGEFKNKYITFSNSPKFVNLNGLNSLWDRLEEAQNHSEVSNTDIEAVFDLILHTAIESNARQEDIPKTILIISDMEFDGATTYSKYDSNYHSRYATLFDTIERNYRSAGYQIPRLVFWNVNSRTNTIPVKENDLGVTLVSGFSVSILKMVQSGELDPYINLVKTITGERYKPLIEAVSN